MKKKFYFTGYKELADMENCGKNCVPRRKLFQIIKV